MTKQDILDYFEYINIAYNNPNKYNDLSRMLDELIETQPMWIPCSEMLPEDCTEVFVYLFNNSCPHIAWIEDTHWYTEDFEIERDDEPVAWMPLPEPYVPDINDGKMEEFNQALSKHKASFNQAEEVLDEIRAEIKKLSPTPTAEDVIDGNEIKEAVWEILADVLKIIDKYKAESEEKV